MLKWTRKSENYENDLEGSNDIYMDSEKHEEYTVGKMQKLIEEKVSKPVFR